MNSKKFNIGTGLLVLYAINSISNTLAQDSDRFEDVERMSDIICGSYQLAGSTDETSLEGKISAEAQLEFLKLKLASGGFEGVADIFTNEYFGLRQDDLAEEKLSVRACKLSVWSDFLKMNENQKDELTETEEVRDEQYVLDVKRPVKILDGMAKIELTKISMQGPFKIATMHVEAPNRPKQSIITSPKSKNFPNFQQFEYRNTMYTVDIEQVFIEDQKAALTISEAE